MKNSKFLKLISLALTVALLIAVAVPTLVTSAEDTTEPNYTRSILKDFEDGVVNTGSAYSVANTSEVGGQGEKCLKMQTSTGNNNNYVFKDTLLKAGRTYYISFYANIYEISSKDNNAWTSLACYDGTKYIKNIVTSVSTSGSWVFVNYTYTPTIDCSLGVVTNDGTYIDNVCIFDVTESATTEWYQAADGNADLANEGLIIPESNSRKVENVFDAASGKFVAAFNLTNTNSGNGVKIPYEFKANKRYLIRFECFTDGTNSTQDGKTSFRYTIGGAGNSFAASGWITGNQGAWKLSEFIWTASQDCSNFHLDAANSGSGYIAVKIRNAVIIEQKDENTATKQTYNFDSQNFNTIKKHSARLSYEVISDENNKLTSVAVFNCNLGANAAEFNPALNVALTQGKVYKISYDYKGKGNIAVSMTSGGWGANQYATELIGGTVTCLNFNTNEWKHRETVFYAQQASTHMYIRGSAGENVYIDNIVIEEYGYKDKEVLDFESANAEYNDYAAYNSFSVVADPVNAENKVLKSTNTTYQSYFVPTMRLQKDHKYYVTVDYYLPALPENVKQPVSSYYYFACDARVATGKTDASGQKRIDLNPMSAESWNTAKFTFTVTEELQNGMIAFLCQRTTYFDNITIIDITDTINTDEPNFDFNNGGEVLFIETSDRTTVTTKQDDEKGAVAKIAFNAGTSTQYGEISLPFALGEGKSYVVKITYKSNAWVACDWADKPIRGDSGLNPTTKWVTETRYISGTNGDLLNFYSNPGTEIYIAKIEITEADEAGGLNGDAVIDATDYTLMRNRFFAAKRDDSTMFEKYADQNGDSTVDVLDMVLLSKIGK